MYIVYNSNDLFNFTNNYSYYDAYIMRVKDYDFTIKIIFAVLL